NPATTIEFSVPQPDKVKLIVFDLLGREVEILVNEEKPQGNYKVIFNASYIPSGVYFYQLITEHYSDTKKMIYLK
ncbi:MAG: T9SS type A sorting domain-containing protein, partial [Ignavibacteria bacterium]|nr:T9SS type A sorting domain-containing protein [Ignavibacteria bacterium]